MEINLLLGILCIILGIFSFYLLRNFPKMNDAKDLNSTLRISRIRIGFIASGIIFTILCFMYFMKLCK